jgi:hypothetical protein
MPQYTSTKTSADGVFVFNMVLDTISNSVTTTVTAGRDDPPYRKAGSIIDTSTQQLPATFLPGAGTDAYQDVLAQSKQATAISEATGNPPPTESAAIPVPPADTPNTVPNASNSSVQNTNAVDTAEYTTDSLGNTFKDGQLYRAVEVVENVEPTSAVGYGDDSGEEFTTDSLGNVYKNGVLYRAAEVVENVEPKSAVGYGDDPGQEFTTDSLGNTYKNGVLYRAAEVADDPTPAPKGLLAPKTNTQSQATQQDISNFQQKADWRVRLSLSPGATYLYKDKGSEGILLPLAATDGVIFPYTPAISVQYAASYDATELTHSNYKFFQYKSSSVDSISLTCDFTAQDTTEANYLLAVIHFFRSVTKMFYGQDQNPRNGTPPPLCYLSGLGAFQFDAHPLAITNFTYALPTDVDYIRAGATTTPGGVSKAPSNVPQNSNNISVDRLKQSGAQPGALAAPVQWAGSDGSREPTYVPTKMQITITAIPIITRNDISNNFSLKKYGTGALLQGTKRKGGGIW